VSANVSNTVALVFSSIGSVGGSRPEWSASAPGPAMGLVAVAGGLAGGLLLLETPSVPLRWSSRG